MGKVQQPSNSEYFIQNFERPVCVINKAVSSNSDHITSNDWKGLERSDHGLIILWHVEPLLGNNLETNNVTTSATKEQIINKQVYAEVAG
jgi:hypothetical protein